MKKSSVALRLRKSRNMFVLIAVAPIAAMILMVILFVYGELQGIKATYHIDSEKIDSPYTIFDKVLLLNSYTKYDFLELQDTALRNPTVFLDEDFLKKENEMLKNKYSFLAVILDGEFIYFGNEKYYDQTGMGILMGRNNVYGNNAQYLDAGSQRFLLKKLGLYLPDGRIGSVCIVTDLNINLPHITIFTIGLICMVVIISILVIIAIIGYAYYNIVIPIRKLQAAVIRIANGEMDYKIQTNETNEFTELFKDFDGMRIALKESIEERNKADALTKEVIGNISHDLKTPLTAIKGYAEGILDGVASTPDRVERYVRTIHSKASDMAGLVDELSYFTKIYQKKETFRFAEVKVYRYFGECISDMVLDLETREIQLLYQCYVDEDTRIMLDTDKIKRVIANIVGNAVKYINRSQGIILIRITDEKDWITVMIRDNGKGIAKEELPYIFDRFYRTDSSRNSRTGGSGLGLAIAKKIVDEHGGEIWAESELNQGTAIYFTIPIYHSQVEE